MVACVLVVGLMMPLTGSIAMHQDAHPTSLNGGEAIGWGTTPPLQPGALPPTGPWWTWTTLDSDRDGVHDSLSTIEGPVHLGLSYGRSITTEDLLELTALGIERPLPIAAVDAILIGEVPSEQIPQLRGLEGVVMVERYGSVVLHGDIQTPAVKARTSELYPGAWDLGVSGEGLVIAMVDTGVDNEHPGLSEKFVAGYDAVCLSDPLCPLTGPGRQTDGTYDPDDGHSHGTACMGMASATGIEADGSQSDFYGAAPNASLVDVRIGTDLGAGPFENYVLEQEFYESAMNGLQWIIDNKDTAWQGADESLHGVDIISLSWGITSHEQGGSDGQDMHSRILDEATEAGIVVSVAAGNDGPDNDGLSGMGSSSLSITVGATDDQNTVDREDDTIAGYSSRGPRRDNGDSDPVNELKPDVTAPGTNIIQSEGCITSDGCHNAFGGSAADNTYTSRGSGTSYATPSVSGILALMMEINPDLDPLVLREILRTTSEVRGEPSAPDVDPHWNRDFGWGMVDARAAVEMADHLRTQGMELDVDLQARIENVSFSGTQLMVTGLAWHRAGEVESVQVRIDDGPWSEAVYQQDDVQGLGWFNISATFDVSDLEPGNHTLEVRSLDASGASSIPSLTTFNGGGGGIAASGGAGATLGQLTVLVSVLALTALLALGARIDPPSMLDD